MAYDDLNTKFRDTPHEVDVITSEIASVRRGLERLLNTPKGHDPFNREYGSSLYNLLFENNVDIFTIQTFLYMDITNWEPRIDIGLSDIIVEKINNTTYQVTCNFRMKDIASGVSTIIVKE